MEFSAVIKKDGLHPVFGSDDEQLRKLKYGVEYKFKVTQPRNIGHHRKTFALLNLCYQNQEKYNNFDHFRAVITMKAGYYDAIETDKGTIYLPQSISFASMDQTEFEEYYKRLLDQVCIWLDTDREDIIEQVVNFM